MFLFVFLFTRITPIAAFDEMVKDREVIEEQAKGKKCEKFGIVRKVTRL